MNLLDTQIQEGQNPAVTSSETPEQRCARLDAERNERDRAARGFDYTESKTPTYKVKVSEQVTFVLEVDPQFGLCDSCGEAAGIVLPSWKAIKGMRRFCGTQCLGQARSEVTANNDDELIV